MFKDLSGIFKKLKTPEQSLIKKLDKMKKVPSATAESSSPDVSEQLKKTQEEMVKKIEELVNSKTDFLKGSEDSVKNLESKINKIDQTVSSDKKTSTEIKNRLDKIDETVLELLSLYEVVSSTVNPFVGDNPNPVTDKLSAIEKRVEELSQKPPEIPSTLAKDVDVKFKALENSIDELRKAMDSKTFNEEALVEKVAEQVLLRIKPLIEQKSDSGQSTSSKSIPSSNSPAFLQQPAQKQQYAPEYAQEEQGIRLPYLDNRHETSIILLNWIEFLMEKVGRNNLIDVLEYYVEINWISEAVSSKMLDFANGIDYYVERPTWKLLPKDHAKSLMFIEQLSGRKIDKTLLSKLERDMDKIIRSEVLLP